jgi:hypothetical protein
MFSDKKFLSSVVLLCSLASYQIAFSFGAEEEEVPFARNDRERSQARDIIERNNARRDAEQREHDRVKEALGEKKSFADKVRSISRGDVSLTEAVRFTFGNHAQAADPEKIASARSEAATNVGDAQFAKRAKESSARAKQTVEAEKAKLEKAQKAEKIAQQRALEAHVREINELAKKAKAEREEKEWA